MHEILRNLPPHSRVLDLGSKNGSFDAERYALSIFRLDLEAPDKRSQNFVAADAAHLLFAAETFACVVANHNLEHIVNLPEALTEIRRVLQPDGSVYVAVPDASTFSDRVYRWLAHGGGHVNAFVSSEATGAMIAAATGLPPRAIRPLLSSFSFANRHNERWSRRIALLGWGNERFLAFLSYGTRVLTERWEPDGAITGGRSTSAPSRNRSPSKSGQTYACAAAPPRQHHSWSFTAERCSPMSIAARRAAQRISSHAIKKLSSLNLDRS